MVSDQIDSVELDLLAQKIGLRKSWKQKKGKTEEHYDVMGYFINKAIGEGIEIINTKRLMEILRKKSNNRMQVTAHP